MSNRTISLLIGLAGLAGAAGHDVSSDAQSQQPVCRPPSVEIARDQLLFTEAQEADLGDAIAEQLLGDFRLIDDDAVTTHLRAIGERLVRQLPPVGLRFEFFLIEMADTTAFVLPGGRVFVSTRLVGAVQSEDELAGVVAHELGHLLARHQAAFLSRAFRRVLGVERVGDRADIFEKYHQLLDNAARNPWTLAQSDSHENREQIAADRLGLFLLASSGYDPQAFARFYDRFAETKGRTGSFLSDFFRTTPPEARRLRELIQTAAALPPECVSRRAASDGSEFRRWQSNVIGYTGRGRKEALTGVVSRTRLEPPLRGQIRHLRFSPDGKFILAQDEAIIAVLGRQPLGVLFTIDAAGAGDAQFSPGSQRVVFLTADGRVETWDLAARKQLQRVDPLGRRPCLQIELAADGASIACLEPTGLTLLDVASAGVIVERPEFEPGLFSLLRLLRPATDDDTVPLINMQFSPDGRFFAAGYDRVLADPAGFAYDIRARTVVPVKADTRRLLAGGFAFTGPDRFIGRNRADSKKSGAVVLPAGDVVQQFIMFPGRLSAPTRSPFVFLRPFDKFAIGVMDVAKGMIVKGTENPAIDIYDEVFVLERGTGELGLYEVAGNRLQATTTLPPSPLGRIRASSVSADFKWLAFSERSRGGTWDLSTGKQVTQMKGFLGALLDETGELFADLPAERQDPRRLVRMHLAQRQGGLVMNVQPETSGFLTGGGFVSAKPVGRNIEIEMRDVRGDRVLWTKTIAAETMTVLVHPASDAAVLTLLASGRIAESEARRSPPLRAQRDALRELDGDYLLQVIDTRTGSVRGSLFVETGRGSFRIRSVFATGDWVLVEDSEGRTRVYALSTGAERGRVFGRKAVMNAAAGLMAIENGAGKLFLYDVATLRRRSDLTFSQPVAMTAFNADGKRLFVLTADQTAYVLAVQ